MSTTAVPTGHSPAGKRVLVTRPGERGRRLAESLERLGFVSVLVPMIAFDPPADPGPLRQAVGRLESYDWAVFTSPRAAEAVQECLAANSLPWPKGARCAAVGPGSRVALEAAGATVCAQSREPRAASMITALGSVQGNRILLPRSDLADGDVAEELRRAGALVDDVIAYRTRLRSPNPSEIAALDRGYDAVVFASGSAVLGYVQQVLQRNLADGGAPAVVCIGQVTAAAARNAGLTVTEVAAEPTDAGVALAVTAAIAGIQVRASGASVLPTGGAA